MRDIKLLWEFFVIGVIATGAAFVAGLAVIFVFVMPILILMEGMTWIAS